MQDFTTVLEQLNKAQREAVETIDGPLLVIAGPGTGKTQLLSARVANILTRTDTPAQNILCVTFTENGANNMRERLTRFIGQAAYDVNISTYHALGGDIIQRNPQYFTETRLQQPVDELGKYQILENLVAKMSYANPLKQTQYHLSDLIGTISEVKRALLGADELRAIANENTTFIVASAGEIAAIFAGVSRMPGKYDAAVPYFLKTLAALQKYAPKDFANERYGSLAGAAIQSLQHALDEAAAAQSSKPLTTWKTKWLAKNTNNEFTLAGTLENRRLEALAQVLNQYQDTLSARGLYDFDDMIVRTVQALETHDELRFSLQERYLYILLDEFQDTNAAQLRLIELLSNNPLSEGRPNIMAVGDDDQAIYAFQGAQYSNMLDFYGLYRDVKVINLTENYRSHERILKTAEAITEQMSERLFHKFPGMQKVLNAANKNIQDSVIIERSEFMSDVAERDFVANRIAELSKKGIPNRQIAILAPRHHHLEAMVPYLNNLNIPV
jgi:DNA helicase II / ATP-dependent DNA helicase PcrA